VRGGREIQKCTASTLRVAALCRWQWCCWPPAPGAGAGIPRQHYRKGHGSPERGSAERLRQGHQYGNERFAKHPHQPDWLLRGELPRSRPYRVEINAPGFQKTTRGPITLDVGNRLTVDVQLQVGTATQSVDVTAEAPLLETASAAQGRVLDSREMAQLPMGTMNPFLMQAMAAGAIFTGSLQPNNHRGMDNAALASYASGGLGSGTNEFLLDGNPSPAPTATTRASSPTRRRWVKCASRRRPTTPASATPWAIT